jgi:hypothetical protein
MPHEKIICITGPKFVNVTAGKERLYPQSGVTGKMKRLIYMVILCMTALNVQAGLVGSLSTPGSEGLVSGGKTWSTAKEGLTVFWDVSQNADNTWHYQYSFANGAGNTLKSQVSHFIISVSQTLTAADVFNFTGDFAAREINTFGPGPSNPNFPAGQTMFGMKIDLRCKQTTVAFDSVRAPMWGDFYAKGGGNPKNYAYNTSFGVQTANLYDMVGPPTDAAGNTLSKILVPDTHTSPAPIPEPATLVLLSLGACGLVLRKRKVTL